MKRTSVLWAAFAALVLSGCKLFDEQPETGFIPGEPVATPYGCVELRKREGPDAC